MNKAKNMTQQVEKLFEKRGTNALELARKAILKEKIESNEIKEALRYFMMDYWRDVERPGLLSIVCESVGGEPEITTDVAVPLILISGGVDIHDDIIDESETKGGRQTLYGRFGKDIALLVGDALFFEGFNLLNNLCIKHPIITDIVKEMFFELGEAEASELKLREKPASPETYLTVISKKAADVEAHTRIGAIIGGGNKKEIETLGEIGRLLGMLIILRDEYIDSLEHEEIHHRIMKEHLPLPIIYALQQKDFSKKLGTLLEKRTLNRKDLDNIIKITREAGGFRYTVKEMNKIAVHGKNLLNKLQHGDKMKLLLNSLVCDLKE
jgi:geranylgeranyl pyrophosphate synthase